MRTSICLRVLASVLLAPLSLFAQYPQDNAKVHRIGYLSPATPTRSMEALREGLKEAGYEEGRNLVIEARYAENRLERLPAMANELVEAKLDVLVGGSTSAVLALQKATKTVPIVFAGLSDPVSAGILTSLASSQGNVTGVLLGTGSPEYAAKWVDLLAEAVPGVSRIAVLKGTSFLPGFGDTIEKAAAARNVKLEFVDASNVAAMDAAFTAIGASGAQALIVTPDPFFNASRAKIAQFAAEQRLPSVSFATVLADAGGLMAYGGNLEASNRKAAAHIDRILKGAKPADLPIQAMPVELVINMKTAKGMGVMIPRALQQRADRLID